MNNHKVLCDTYVIGEGLKLITEATELKDKQINSKSLGVLEGPCADLVDPTRNTNLYSKKLWKRVVESEYVKEALETKTLFGEVDHPFSDRLEISMQEAAICCTALWFNESETLLMGRFDILPTEKGKILKAICDYGSIVGVSSRGVGDVEETNGIHRVDEDTYLFVCFDAVVQPAAIKARQQYTSLTESEKKTKNVSLVNDLMESINNTQTETDLKFIENLIQRLNLNEEESLKKLIKKQYAVLKRGENYNIIKKNERLMKDLEEAYKRIKVLENMNSRDNLAADLSFIRSQIFGIRGIIEEGQNNLIQVNSEKDIKLSESQNKINNLSLSIKTLKETNNNLQRKLQRQEKLVVELNEKVDYAKEFVKKCKSSIEGSRLTEQKYINKINTLNESLNTVANNGNTQRLSENLLKEYITQKEKTLGIKLDSARTRLNKIKSLSDIDLMISETLKHNPNVTSQKQGPTNEDILKENVVPKISAPNAEEESVVSKIFDIFYNKDQLNN